MPWSILRRYVLWELLRVFTLALLAITGILVMAPLSFPHYGFTTVRYGWVRTWRRLRRRR